MNRNASLVLRFFLIAALAVLADWLILDKGSGVITVNAEGDDCGWVVDWNNPDGGYCSYYANGAPAETYAAEESYS